METELKTAIWKIANAAIEMHEDKLNGKEFEELAMDALRQVKNLNIPCVVGRSEQLVCDKCGYPMFYHKPDDIMYCHGCNNTKPAN